MTGFDELSALLDAHAWSYTVLAIALLSFAAWVADWLTRRVLVRGFYRIVNAKAQSQERMVTDHGVVRRLAHAVPAVVLWSGVALVPNLPGAVVTVVRNVASAYIVLTLALAVGALLNLINDLYQRRPDAASRPIKGYLQVLKIAIYSIATILMIAALIDRSPLILLSGLGAMAAVLMLIFQDTLLSLVASVQLTSNDMVRVGDWIEMPQLNADGEVIDIALHTVKVQNWDKTITTIPTKRLISESFKNWRGMQQSGGRRIKRAIYIDQTSIRFLSAEERKRLHRFMLLDEYLTAKQREIDEWNARLAERGRDEVNTRRVTNIGTFRAYCERYLRSHPGVHQGMTIMVRQLAPGPTGLPLEIYCFTNNTAWVVYEGIQSDIFDHLLAIMSEFGLRVFQEPTGNDLRTMLDWQRKPEHGSDRRAVPALESVEA